MAIKPISIISMEKNSVALFTFGGGSGGLVGYSLSIISPRFFSLFTFPNPRAISGLLSALQILQILTLPLAHLVDQPKARA